MKRLFPILLLPLLLAGCVTNTITNLTVDEMPRSANGLYPIEMAWDSNQQSLRHESIKPYVVMGFQAYEMQPTLGLKDRWESYIPIPATEHAITYHFKVDYEYRQVGGEPGKASKLSRVYKLSVLDE